MFPSNLTPEERAKFNKAFERELLEENESPPRTE
jgi:hypothetical protein